MDYFTIFTSEWRHSMCSASGISTGANVLGTYSQMQAAKSNASYQAAVANQNAAIANAQSISAGMAGADEQGRIRDKTKQVAGSQKAAFAANGLDIQSGSALSTLSDTALMGEQDVQTSRQNTQQQMWGYDVQAMNYRNQAKAAKAEGRNQSRSALLTGITSLAKQYQ